MYTEQSSIMPNLFTPDVALDLQEYLQDMSQDASNPVDLELALDYLETQDIQITDAVVNYVTRFIDINF